MNITYEILKSWNDSEGNVNSMDDILNWIRQRNEKVRVCVEKVNFSYHGFWYYDETTGYIRNESNSFFQLAGYQIIENDQIVREQPIIIQNEIGYLGIICKMVNGTLNFLMQAKIEPGNVNVIQLSPTIQATKSNFTRQHGGKCPSYLEYFTESSKHKVIVDQLQSEQSSRFYKKRNRNIIIMVTDDVVPSPNHMWMTLGQIKQCMLMKNLVNMDTRTVLSCIPISLNDLNNDEFDKVKSWFQDKPLFCSMFKDVNYNQVRDILNVMNDYKMYRNDKCRFVPLKSLKSWKMNEREIACKTAYDFKVIYCRVEIENREVKYWEQPMLEAMGISIFGLFTCIHDDVRKFLVRVKHEIGCFDSVELGPTIQMEPTNPKNSLTEIDQLFFEKLNSKDGLMMDVILSEEGGRFYHEQNRNVILEINQEEAGSLPTGFYWIDFATLNHFIQFNNYVNIQLRNLVALLNL